MTHRIPALIVTGLLAACSGGGSGGGASVDNGICHVIADNGATSSASAIGASVADPARVFDGDLDSAAVLTPLAVGSTATVYGALGAGSEPGGQTAGILFEGETVSNLAVTVTTYLDDVVQESGPPVTTSNINGLQFFGINTLLEFDAIEVTFDAAPAELLLYELCVRD